MIEATFKALAARATHLSAAERRFLAEVLPAKVRVEGECWVWIGNVIGPPGKLGYGGTTIQRRSWRVHRLVGQALFGAALPRDLMVCHRCDNRLCSRPVHLFIGTHTDNMNDMINKNRSRFGSKHHNAKLSEENVRFIRSRLELSEIDLALEFGVSKRVVIAVRKGIIWKHVT